MQLVYTKLISLELLQQEKPVSEHQQDIDQ
jgi:hypothetical protein